MTVREAFSLAFGPVPDGATCHLGIMESRQVAAMYCIVDDLGKKRDRLPKDERFIESGWAEATIHIVRTNPNISGCPAYSFLGFFGKAYDQVVSGEQP